MGRTKEVRHPAEVTIPAVTRDNSQFREAFAEYVGHQFDAAIQALPVQDRETLTSEDYRAFMEDLRNAFVQNVMTAAFNPSFPDSRALNPRTTPPVSTGLDAALVGRLAQQLNSRLSAEAITDVFNRQYPAASEQNPPIRLSVVARGDGLVISNGITAVRENTFSQLTPRRESRA